MSEALSEHDHHHAGEPAPDSGFRGSTLQRVISLVCRLGLAGVLIAAGGLKIADPQQAALAVQAYQIFPTHIGEMIGYGLPLVELGLGVLLLLGLGTRLVAVISGTLMIIFIAGVASAWARGLSISCGCFGNGGVVPKGTAAYLPDILRDTGFFLLAVWLVVFPVSLLALDRSGRAGTGDTGLYDEFDEFEDDEADETLDDAAQSADSLTHHEETDR